jgi:4-amino-4-deoxy-L-arabinose transferase-like glycosyltransferase
VPARSTVLLTLAGLTALGVAVRFGSLGLQSYHHDEVITAARVIPGSFFHMLTEVKASESNPPLYYVLAWIWSKLFGTGEVGLRSLSALFGVATIPVVYLICRQLASERAGLIGAAIVAVNPMLIWYSQEARSYALVVFFGALALYFFVRALQNRDGHDLAFWALATAMAINSHYFAVFPAAIEALWLLVALRSRWRATLPAVGGVAVVGLALMPLIMAQANPTHIGWIDHSLLSARFYETGVSFLIGETGHVIAEPPRNRFAFVPAVLIGAALLLVVLRGGAREKRGAATGIIIGAGVALLAGAAALVGHDYIVERNLLPALVPLIIAAAIGFAARGARRAGLVCAIALCTYWFVFDIHVTQTPNLQRPDFRGLTAKLGKASQPRAIVTWKLAADPVQFYLADGAERIYSGEAPVREIDVVSKPIVARQPPRLPKGFHPVQRLRLERLTLTRYMSNRLRYVPFYVLRNARTGFGRNAVVLDGLPSQKPPIPGEPEALR